MYSEIPGCVRPKYSLVTHTLKYIQLCSTCTLSQAARTRPASRDAPINAEAPPSLTLHQIHTQKDSNARLQAVGSNQPERLAICKHRCLVSMPRRVKGQGRYGCISCTACSALPGLQLWLINSEVLTMADPLLLLGRDVPSFHLATQQLNTTP